MRASLKVVIVVLLCAAAGAAIQVRNEVANFHFAPNSFSLEKSSTTKVTGDLSDLFNTGSGGQQLLAPTPKNFVGAARTDFTNVRPAFLYAGAGGTLSHRVPWDNIRAALNDVGKMGKTPITRPAFDSCCRLTALNQGDQNKAYNALTANNLAATIANGNLQTSAAAGA